MLRTIILTILIQYAMTDSLKYKKERCNFLQIIGCSEGIYRAEDKCKDQKDNYKNDIFLACVKKELENNHKGDCFKCTCNIIPDSCPSQKSLRSYQLTTAQNKIQINNNQCLQNCDSLCNSMKDVEKPEKDLTYQNCNDSCIKLLC